MTQAVRAEFKQFIEDAAMQLANGASLRGSAATGEETAIVVGFVKGINEFLNWEPKNE